MRIVIVAENASNKFGGESLLPVHYFRILRSRQIETWLVVHGRTQAELEALFPEECDRMHFVPDTWVHRLLNNCGRFLPPRLGAPTLGLLSHLYTQVLQRGIVDRLVSEKQIDIVHEPTPVSAKFPSLMFALGVPVVMGPLNTAVKFPLAFRSRQNRSVDILIEIGYQFVNLFNRLLPGKIKAETVLVANDRTKQALPAGVQGKIIELVENGVDLSVWRSESMASKEPNQQIHFVFLGRLADWKGVDLLLEAFRAVAAQTDAVLEIIGDGEMRGELEAQTARLGQEARVVFSGWLSQDRCALKLQQADVLVLPSLREPGGAVVMEAMAVGLPVIATNWGGPMDYIDSSCGILVEPASKEGFVKGLTDAMLKLAQSQEMRQSMGRAGWERVREHFDWERKVDRMIEIYQQTIDTCQKH
ncbi:MAG: glycosyltransferase family 4 protein [Microcoleus sp. PH2017_29_MFU_D_A]|jgi:glycosyltransferase involved in cell wall biosynthesis|uniref:glycosyltransferase family 4 protein n=1 Tax=unclassified Microcoleus TaxID=2642155 RepID=UPI001D51BF67|nr:MULTISPECIES: glycosyltransferase [unclassified Microcoleus]MCC3507990.1 glycosyltransferase family 4 protein [Microcoleus sp. PH2017_17_BER_D_A]TAE55433.1 MAG: glycosyltransferase family 4 protein [Oscillatoriales cyanobacterium]MCC3438590.1 glycosyltransferase family 4 protein [Microcoleus sp. PH2017_05_CCC_O_A]MCC3472035.1 glycosyltransferase family 4 protein [Microcoleus sp. PH2017_13_LAR_U_A]MCC3484581.1 glycosyltransferase family 4 protein [Microcoleus sp. PH2017_14_LAR_D_A]